jgi:hypothetical protein
MRTLSWQTCISLVISILAVPAFMLGAKPMPGPGRAEPAPIANSDSVQASQTLDNMQTDALRVNDEADLLQSDARSEVSWQSDAITIDRMADRVRKMDRMLEQLRTVQNQVIPMQSRLISRIAPQVTVLTDELNDSIHFLNRNHEDLWSPKWHDYISEMFQTSGTLEKDLRHVREEQEASLRQSPANFAGIAS